MGRRIDKLRNLSNLEAELRKRGQPSMSGRGEVENELMIIENELRSLIVAYEQYFMGVDKFEPAKERQILNLRMRRLVNHYIPQVDLRFRLQTLTGRLQSYSSYWDRTLRLIEEGRYVRQRSHMKWSEQLRPEELSENFTATAPGMKEMVYRDLVDACVSCQMAPPDKAQVDSFLDRQAEAIRARFGERPVNMIVVVENGKPKIRVRAKE